MTRAVGGLLALWLLAGTAAAETEPYAGVSVEQLFDSNVMNSRGPDAVTRVTPRVGILLEDQRFTLDADYRLGLHAYAAGTADDSINHRAALFGRAVATPRFTAETRMTLVAGDDPVLLDRPGVAVPQGAFVDLAGQIGGAWRATRRLTLDLSYLYRRSRFDLASGPMPLAFDGDEHRIDAAADYRMTRRWTLRTLARGQHFVGIGPMDTLGDALGTGAGLIFALNEHWRMRGEAGPLWFTGSGVTWFALTEVSWRGRSTRWAVQALRELYGGTGAAEAIWTESLIGEGTFRFGRGIGLRIRAGGYRNGAAPAADADVSGLLVRADLGWLIFSNHARLELYAEHRAQDADGGTAFGDVQRTVAGLRLVAVAGTDLLSLGDIP